MNEFPDVLGMELHDAAALLEAEGLDFIIEETKPSKKELEDGTLRVIRILPADKDFDRAGIRPDVVLTVCRI